MVCEQQVMDCENTSSTRMETVHSPPVRADDGLQAKWRICLHEAGHLLAGVRLLGHTSQAMTFRDNIGLAYIGVGGIPRTDAEATAVAVGEVAEALSRKYSPPQVEMRTCPDAERPEYVDRIKAGQFDDSFMPDAMAIARWCIADCESRPYRWKRRYEWLYDQADAFVEEHELQILSLAQQLFSSGSLTVSASPTERQ